MKLKMILQTSREIFPAKGELIATRETARAREEERQQVSLLVWTIIFNLVKMTSIYLEHCHF